SCRPVRDPGYGAAAAAAGVDQRFWGCRAAAAAAARVFWEVMEERLRDRVRIRVNLVQQRLEGLEEPDIARPTEAAMAVGRAYLAQGVALEFKTETLPPQVVQRAEPSTETLM